MAAKRAGRLSWPDINLNNGNEMPAIGLSTSNLYTEETLSAAVDAALANGCKSFLSSGQHKNDLLLGNALRHYLPLYDLQREDIYLIRKLQVREMISNHAFTQACTSMKQLDSKYIDLLLMSCPGDPYPEKLRPRDMAICNRTWIALMKLYDTAEVNSIGLSNFSGNQLDQFLCEKHSVIPAVNQVIGLWDSIPNFKYIHELENSCGGAFVILQEYSPLSESIEYSPLRNQILIDIAMELRMTPTQVFLVWSLQNDIPVILDSIDPVQLRENLQLEFQLSERQNRSINQSFRQLL